MLSNQSQILRCIAVGTAVCLSIPTSSYAQSAPYENGLRRPVLFDDASGERLTLSARMKRWKILGLSVAVIEDCQIVDARGFGVTERGGGAVDGDTIFQAASVSKPVAAYVALKLVEDGRLTLDGDVAVSLKSWRLPDSALLSGHPVTLRRLLSHTAGLGPSGYGGYPQGEPLPSLVQILNGEPPAKPKPIQINVQPGTEWRYSGGGYMVAEQLMIDVTDQPFPALAQEVALAPLGMSHSSFASPTEPANVALAHNAAGEVVEGGWLQYPEHAAAGLWSTPSDLALFAIDVMHARRGEPGAVLGKTSADLMVEPTTGPRSVGFVVTGEDRARTFGHDGTNEGYNAMLIAYPETCQGAVLMANSDNAKPLMSEVLRAIAEAYQWPDPMPSLHWTSIPLTPAIIAQYVGRYQFVDLPDIPALSIVGSLEQGLTFERGDGHTEPLDATEDGLIGRDSGILITTADPAARQASTIIYRRLAASSGAEARRLQPE